MRRASRPSRPNRPSSGTATLLVIVLFIAVGIFSIIEGQGQTLTAEERAARRARMEAVWAGMTATPKPAAAPTSTAPAPAAQSSGRDYFPTTTLQVSFILPSTETGMIITPANLPALTVRGTPGQKMTIPVKVNLSPTGSYSVNLTSIPSGIQEQHSIGKITVQ